MQTLKAVNVSSVNESGAVTESPFIQPQIKHNPAPSSPALLLATLSLRIVLRGDGEKHNPL